MLLRRRHVVGKIKTIDRSSKHRYLEGLLYVVPLDVAKLLRLLKIETWSEVMFEKVVKCIKGVTSYDYRRQYE